ncbi:MAG: nitrate/sulfonate/bicarbonate ABC transporter ATP-binding protein [Anaerolineales bacterium]|nr:nitrate/sulfonate/bicarbonate ABC transporter ATP-binding protein [Anaerolineales bacterium]
MMSVETPLLELKHIHQTYTSGARKFTAVEDVNLTVHEGEYVALLGPSGCGKSTLLRILTGLQKPSEGQVLYRGQVLRGVNPHATIVFQTFALFPWLTVLENVELALKARGIPAGVRLPRALDLIDRVGLDGFENAYPRELSGGMRQKVGFARAMAVEPELLCLDEPFSALDVLSAESLRGELLELWTSGKIPTKAILMVSHNIEEAVFMADRIVVMDKEPGRIIAEMKVPLPHPRPRHSDEFRTLVDEVYALLAGQTKSESEELGSAPGESGRVRSLPDVHISDLAGLLEHLAEKPGDQADIYRLTEELTLDSDHVLRLSEAAELLGFATIAKGDIQLTPLGETFAEASILARKEIFATRIRRLPLVRWLTGMLQRAEKHALKGEVVKMALQLEFPPEEAEKQLDTLINWGRYAEIFAYDDGSEEIYLESAPGKVKV